MTSRMKAGVLCRRGSASAGDRTTKMIFAAGLAPNAARIEFLCLDHSFFPLYRAQSAGRQTQTQSQSKSKRVALYFGRSNHQTKRRFFAADARRFFAPGVTLRCSLRLAAPLTPGFMLSHAPRLGGWRDCDPENRECYPWPMKGHARRTTANDK